MVDQSIFKAYDIRGIYPDQLDEKIIYAIAQGYVDLVKPKKVVLGRDVRTSGESLWQAAKQGFVDAGVDVVDIGVVSTDMMYFAVVYLAVDGGLTISASHNPREYNGVKMVRRDAVPISGDSGIVEIKEFVLSKKNITSANLGSSFTENILDAYIEHCISFIDTKKLQPVHIVANANFGMAGVVFDEMIAKADLPVSVERLNFKPDGTFPKGRPDPLVPENRVETAELVRDTNADFAVAWDADADRCFFFDEKGNFIDGYYIVALLASILLEGTQDEKVIIDPRMVFATRDAIRAAGGIPIVNKVGHTFIKERMRKENAIFAGENSAHLYFRDNFFADNGIIPLLLIMQKISESGKKLSELVAPWTTTVFVSGEINFEVHDALSILKRLREKYFDASIDDTDGLSFEYEEYRFNVRLSNTEPLLRLNIESYDKQKVDELVTELRTVITSSK